MPACARPAYRRSKENNSGRGEGLTHHRPTQLPPDVQMRRWLRRSSELKTSAAFRAWDCQEGGIDGPRASVNLVSPGCREHSERIVPTSSRDLRLDFFRGLALIFIFIDHIPENLFGYFTIQAVQLFDAAEIFIFISGYTAALVYGRILATQGPLFGAARILGRAWQLYVAHVFLFVLFTAEVSYTVATFNNPMYNDEMGVADFLEQPHVAIVKALLLEFQPTFLALLPLYIILFFVFPPVP